LADGRIAINTNTASPGLFFKDSAGTGIVKVGPVHVGTTAPNSVPASGGSTGNYTGEQWLDTSVSPAQMKVWNGSTWVGIVADELPVSKLQDGAARQLIQTDAAGTGVEWTSNVDVPGTLDVTSTATFDSIAQHPLGIAGAPTITFTGNTNTGIYSPGTNQVAISTNGTGRLFVDSSGRLLVGTSSAATTFFGGTITPQLQLEGTNSNTSTLSLTRRENGNAAALLSFGKTRGGTTVVQADDGLGFISFEGSDGTNLIRGASITAAVDGTPGANDMPGRIVFSTTADGASSPTERMRITSSGQLLVGTSSAVNNADLQAANSISVGGTIKREVSKRLNLADNTSTTLFTFQIPGGSSQSHRTYVGGEISYIVAVGRETSSRNSRTTYGKVYFSIDRFWESNANNPVSDNLIDTDKSLSTSNGSAPTITWAITTDAGIDNAAKNVYLAITVDNPFTNTIQTNITGTISYHTLSFSDVTLS
jgi:hypothetical protein